jgi:TolB-like protein
LAILSDFGNLGFRNRNYLRMKAALIDMSKEPKITFAVFPFENVSEDKSLAYFAAGFTEDLRIELSRFPSLRVLASQSIVALLESGMSVEDVADEWGLQYFFQGSVRRTSSALRVNLKLVNCEGMQIVWAYHLDSGLKDVITIQDEIIGKLANRLSLYIDEDTLNRARRRSNAELKVYDCYLRGVECLSRGSLEGDEESRVYFEKALELDPRYPRAYVGLSLSYFNEWSCQAWHLWQESERNAFDYATKAKELDDTDAMVHAVLGRVLRYRREHERADVHADQALKLNPNDASVLIQVALVKLFGGDWKESESLARKAIRLNPLQSEWYHGVVGWSLFFQDRIEDALAELRVGNHFIVNFGLYRAACLLLLNDSDGARAEYNAFALQYRQKIAFGREPEPGEAVAWAVQVEPFRNPDDSQRMRSILMGADLENQDLERLIERQQAPAIRPANIAVSLENRFVRKEDVWTISYDGTSAQLIELKGFHDIAFLLRQPGEAAHSIELIGGAETSVSRQEQLDDDARREYRERIEELQGDIERAVSLEDAEGEKRLQQELDTLIDELARATGLAGRTRHMTDSAERARSAVTWRIRSAIKKIQAAHPSLGQHLKNSIRTGIFCSYQPEKGTSWHV